MPTIMKTSARNPIRDDFANLPTYAYIEAEISKLLWKLSGDITTDIADPIQSVEVRAAAGVVENYSAVLVAPEPISSTALFRHTMFTSWVMQGFVESTSILSIYVIIKGATENNKGKLLRYVSTYDGGS